MSRTPIIHEASFDPKLKTYLFLMGFVWLAISVVGLALAPVWLFVGPMWARRYFDSISCVLTTRALEVKKGVLFRSERTIPLDKIQDVALQHGPLLRRLGEDLYEGRDPAGVYYSEPTYRLDEEEDHYLLHIHLPFLDGVALEAAKYGDQLVVNVGNQRRNYALPKFLGYYHVAGTSYADGWLSVRFESEKDAGPRN